jgi:hypothetical protein
VKFLRSVKEYTRFNRIKTEDIWKGQHICKVNRRTDDYREDLTVVLRTLSVGVKQPECEADHQTTFSAELKNAQRYMSSWHGT